MQTEERFLRYTAFDTRSEEGYTCIPSTEKQRRLAKALAKELKAMGAQKVRVSECAYVYAQIPATVKKDVPALGFIAHMDTSPEVSGENVRPVIVKNYGGGDVLLNKDKNIVFPAKEYPQINDYIGHDIIFSDGTTLLGADDKAGVAEIMTMAEHLLKNTDIPHGRIMIAFTPDEEVGHGADDFDIRGFKADIAYTVDGEAAGEIEYENFNAASALVTVHGCSIHPGTAKGKMKNACLMAMEFHEMLPPEQAPFYTQGYEGFYHLGDMEGSVELATLKYAIRDHDAALFEQKKALMREAAFAMNEKYGSGSIELEISDSYYNMKEKILPHMHLIDNAKKAMENVGLTPKILPIRGGTDGARLSYMGLPCPNLGTGGHNFHSRYEFISIQSMQKVTQALIELVKIYGA